MSEKRVPSQILLLAAAPFHSLYTLPYPNLTIDRGTSVPTEETVCLPRNEQRAATPQVLPYAVMCDQKKHVEGCAMARTMRVKTRVWGYHLLN